MRRLVVALWILVLVPSALCAQVLVGTVRDAQKHAPVLGAMVRLMTDTSWTGVRYLTGSDGHFILKAPAPGRYHLVVERIGFASTTSDPVDLDVGDNVPFDMDVEADPVRLEGLQVHGSKRNCSLKDDPEGATQTLWIEVRKALDAERWTEKEAGLRFTLEQRSVILDPSGHHVLDDKRHTISAFGGNSVRTLEPDKLVESGYVQQDRRSVYWFGPDANVLLSDAFLETHCFRLVEAPEDEPGLVGLEFEPVRGRKVADIQGVLWVERATSRLNRVEFKYSGLPLGPGRDQARGELRFAELSDGRWIVMDWSIRAPFLRVDHTFIGGQLHDRTVVQDLREQGSRVLSAKGADVDWKAPARGGVSSPGTSP